jgi:predicted ATPase
VSDLRFDPLNVLIGANGSGKSNLIGFFKLLNWMTPAPGNLQEHIGTVGGANSILHDGAAVTPQIEADLKFETEAGMNEYYIRLFHAAQDTLIFAEERYRYSRFDFGGQANWRDLGSGHRESALNKAATFGDETAQFILKALKRCVVYQFHNTSSTARLKQRWAMDDNYFLKEDAANLAPFLFRLREQKPKYYERITATIRQIAPFFADFELQPVNGTVILQWREKGSDLIFGPHQASDGSLRLFALLTLLLQPEEQLPAVIILDEPELGMHPYAINIIAGLLRSVSTRSEVILATQSMTLLGYFEPEEIIVVDRPRRESHFRRLEAEPLKEWLQEYSLPELWEKNVIGGRPAPTEGVVH